MDSEHGSKKILLVDDEPVIRETLCSILREEGYGVTTASTGNEAMSMASRNGFDVAIIDLKLPDVDGVQVLRSVKDHNPAICAILITAYPTTESAIRAIQEEAYEYITKPFDIGHVKLVIKRGLEEKSLEAENRRLVYHLQNEKDKLQIMLEIGHVMSSILNLDELAMFIAHKVSDVLQAKVCSLMLLDPDEEVLTIRAAVGLDEVIMRTTRVKLGQSISGWVAQRGETVMISDIESDVTFGRASLPKYETKSLLCIPLKVKDRVLGVINAADKKSGNGFQPFTDEDARFLGMVANYAAIALENAQLYGEVNNLAITDGLTNLFNHRYFQTQLAAEVARIQRYPHPLSLIMFDIDYFKKFNDTHGHPVGDTVLRQISRVIRKSVRKVDIPCRYGGEEFAVILPETGIKDSSVVAEKIRRTVEELRFEADPKSAKKKMTLSGGIAEYKPGMSKEELVRYADEALYRAKHEGKNRICVHTFPLA